MALVSHEKGGAGNLDQIIRRLLNDEWERVTAYSDKISADWDAREQEPIRTVLNQLRSARFDRSSSDRDWCPNGSYESPGVAEDPPVVLDKVDREIDQLYSFGQFLDNVAGLFLGRKAQRLFAKPSAHVEIIKAADRLIEDRHRLLETGARSSLSS